VAQFENQPLIRRRQGPRCCSYRLANSGCDQRRTGCPTCQHPGAFGDEIGVATSWQLPGVFSGLPPDALETVQAKINSADWGYDPRSEDWAGKAIAATFDLDLSDEVQKRRVKRLLKAWKESGALNVLQKPSPTTRGRDRNVVVVGNRVEGTAAQDDLHF
jgi:hypothetical protein